MKTSWLTLIACAALGACISLDLLQLRPAETSAKPAEPALKRQIEIIEGRDQSESPPLVLRKYQDLGPYSGVRHETLFFRESLVPRSREATVRGVLYRFDPKDDIRNFNLSRVNIGVFPSRAEAIQIFDSVESGYAVGHSEAGDSIGEFYALWKSSILVLEGNLFILITWSGEDAMETGKALAARWLNQIQSDREIAPRGEAAIQPKIVSSRLPRIRDHVDTDVWYIEPNISGIGAPEHLEVSVLSAWRRPVVHVDIVEHRIRFTGEPELNEIELFLATDTNVLISKQIAIYDE